MKKRILGIILCLCLLVQLLPAVGLASDTITGIVPLKAGQDVATIRCELADKSYTFLDFTKEADGYHYSFEKPDQSYEIIPEYFSTTVWDGAVDISWYDETKDAFYLDTPAQLAGLAALVCGNVDIDTPDYRIKGDQKNLVSTKVDDYLLIGAGGGDIHDTVYVGDPGHDFSDKTVYLTCDMDMGGVNNWVPIGGKYPLDVENCTKVVEAFFNGTLDGQGHRITNVKCNRYGSKHFGYSEGIGLVGYLGQLYENEVSPKSAPSVRNLSVSGDFYGRRRVGGVVGRSGSVPTGIYIENCANFASVKSTDAKGVGGIIGAGWSKGAIVNCYNAGEISTTYACPAGGICASNQGLDIYNCFNVGTIDSNGNQRGRGIGGHDSGSYTIADTYYLEGCDDDTESHGWYAGNAITIHVDIAAKSESYMKSQDFVDSLNCNGDAFVKTENGYPRLAWEQDNTGKNCNVTFVLNEQGSVSATQESPVRAGTVLHLTNKPASGWAFRAYTLNGKRLTSPFATVTQDAAIGGIFEALAAGALYIEANPACDITVVKESGMAVVDGQLTAVQNYPVKDGDALYEGDKLRATAKIHDGMNPDDLNYVYTGAFEYSFTYEDENKTHWPSNKGDATVSSLITTASLHLSVLPLMTHKVWTQLAETDWYDASKTEFTLTTARQLAGLASLVKQGNTFSGKTVRLGKDVSLNNDDATYSRSVRWFDGIGSTSAPFSGTFDGNGYKITDMRAEATTSYSALFLATDGATLQNIQVSGVAKASGYVAAIVSSAKNTTIKNCTADVAITALQNYAGGIAAYIDGGTRITGCVSRGTINGADGVGGIVGACQDTASSLTGCVNYGAIAADGSSAGAGGIAGRMNGSMTRCANYGTVTGKVWYLGGLAGSCNTDKGGVITGCYNIGAVTSTSTYGSAGTGGLIGYGNYYKLQNCYDYGTVTAAKGTTGAIVGRDSRRSYSSRQRCYYLTGACANASNNAAQETNVEAISAAVFASDAFAGRLNEGLTPAAFAQAGNGYPEFLAGCAHDGATHRENARAATCTTAGYTGDLICDLCGETIEAGQAIAPFACPSTGFTDRPATTSWDHAGIDFALNSGLFFGTSSTQFSPSGAMTRAMLVTVLWRLDGRPEPKSSNPFQDVPANQYYCDAVTWASENNIVAGMGQGRFAPDASITREQIAAIIYRYAAWKGYDTSARADLSPFPDLSQVSSWATANIAWANAEGLISGNQSGGQTYLLPQGNATRAQVAAILMRYVARVAKNESG